MNLPPLLRILLWPLSQVYGIYVRCRYRLYAHGWLKPKRLNATVISVGNLTVGGTGKTPMVLWLAEKFLTEGKRVAILSRGYHGSPGRSDEIELLRHRLDGKVLFGVGPDRFASGSRLLSENVVDVFLLDDGFQHLQLARDLEIVMLDGSCKLKNEWLLPAGSLREPLAACRRLISWWCRENLRDPLLKLAMLTPSPSFTRRRDCLDLDGLDPTGTRNTLVKSAPGLSLPSAALATLAPSLTI